jgi:ankyrin repeat protein
MWFQGDTFNVVQQTTRGFTPLHMAASRGNKAMAELLLAHGAKINAISKEGATPLHLAAKQNRQEMAEFLHSSGGLDPPVSQREWPYP